MYVGINRLRINLLMLREADGQTVESSPRHTTSDSSGRDETDCSHSRYFTQMDREFCLRLSVCVSVWVDRESHWGDAATQVKLVSCLPTIPNRYIHTHAHTNARQKHSHKCTHYDNKAYYKELRNEPPPRILTRPEPHTYERFMAI